LAGSRILLVEDNELNQEVAAEILKDAGFVVDIADNGQIALDMLNQASYDIVLMDMQMPVMDGVTATVEIRKQPQFAGLPIVAMTANAMQQDRERCQKAGMNDHVAKPIEPDELWKALRKWIKPRVAAPAVPAAAPLPPAASAPSGGDELPRHIDGLDVELGLRRVIGKHHLYISMLRKFVAGQKNAAANICAALDDNDAATAERLAHTLKGTAGNIGASQLQSEAGALEAAIRAGRERAELDALLTTLAPRLATLVGAVEAWLPADPATARTTTIIDPAAFQPLLTRLAMLLGDYDSEAGDLWEENAELFRSAFPEHWRKIEEGLRNFDLEAALAALRSATQARGMEG
jgi:two-component system, sensor histidine kinase and response regulator